MSLSPSFVPTRVPRVVGVGTGLICSVTLLGSESVAGAVPIAVSDDFDVRAIPAIASAMRVNRSEIDAMLASLENTDVTQPTAAGRHRAVR